MDIFLNNVPIVDIVLADTLQLEHIFKPILMADVEI